MILNTTERRVAMKTLRDVKTGSTVKVVKLHDDKNFMKINYTAIFF